MSGFSAIETAACMHLVELGLREDLGAGADPGEDITTDQFIVAGTKGKAIFAARQAGVIAGGDITLEAAVAKLIVLLGRGLSGPALRKALSAAIRGERSC